MVDRQSPHRFFMPNLSKPMADTLEMGGICFEAGAMVGIAFHQVADCVQKAPLRLRRLGSKLPMALRSAVPVVVMNLVLIGLVAFRFWATFPVVDDAAAGSCNVPVRTSGTHRGACQDIPTDISM
jgi:hypothetical protein